MSSLSAKDRVSLCSFTFSDGRRCRTPRNRNHPHFCFYHAQKEARARAADTLGKDLAYFFSGDYLSACDLSTALGRLIPAVLRGDVKPRAARTVAYMAQTLLQAIHVSQHEYSYAFGDDGWCKSIRNSVKYNHDYRRPPAPKPDPEQQMVQDPHVVAGLQTSKAQTPQPGPVAQPTPQPAPSPHTSLPPTSAEFVQHVVAGLKTGGGHAPQRAQTPVNCHSDAVAQAFRPEEPARSSPAPTQIQAQQNSPTPPAKAHQPTSVAPFLRSGALPPHVRRRLHRAPA